MKILILRRLLLGLFIAALTCNVSIARNVPDIDKMKVNLQYLSSDQLEGRLPATDGNIKAGEYILAKFKEYGLSGINGNFEQSFYIPNTLKPTDKNEVSLTKIIEKPGLPKEMWTKAVKKWTLGSEYFPISLSKNGTATGEIAFVGYGISAKELNYDDYEGIDVKGKIVIILSDSADGKPLDQRFTSYSTLKYKVSNAFDHGAVGIIFIKRLSDSANTFYPLKIARFGGKADLVAVQANRTEIAKYFPKEKNLYPSEMKLMETKKPQSFILPNCSVTITTELITEDAAVKNIFGFVKGTDSKLEQEYIVVGAHYDHIGWGAFNSSHKGKPAIHNGADDNSSGVTAMLELARIIAANPLKRSVIFTAFNCEEMGLLGSDFFVKNPPVDLSRIVTMVNLDMVGRMTNNQLTVFGTGSSDSFDAIVDATAIADSITVTKNSDGYGPSDQSSFDNIRIPVLFMFTGTHLDYHSPADDYEKINFNGLAKVVYFTDDILRAIDLKDERPKFLEQKVEKSSAPQGRGREGISVSFGSVPDFSKKVEGFALNGCKPGSPCEKSGLKAGDIIIYFGDKTIKDIGGFTDALKTMKPGDIVKIKYIRDGKELETKSEMMAK
jgi:hypothetical protein